MNKSLILVLLIFLGACLSEEKADLADPSTFIRYFSDGYQDVAVTVEETADKGFIILANSTLQDSEAEDPLMKITLIKTDQFGHEVWRQHFPEFGEDNIQYAGHGLVILPSGGYLIVGEEIETPAPLIGEPDRQLLFIKVDVDPGGENLTVTRKVFLSSNVNTVGQAVALGDAGSFLVLASRPGESKEIFVGEFDSALDTIWTRKYDQGKVKLANRIFYQAPNLAFGGEQQQSASTFDGFVTPTPKDQETPPGGFTQRIGTSTSNDFVGDFCLKGSGFGFVGYTDTRDAGDIAFYEVNAEGSQISSTIYDDEIFNGTPPPGVTNNKKEIANSIAGTKDGGFIILGTIDTYTGVLGSGNTDLFMLKIDGFGGKIWSRPYGSLQADRGNCIRQTSDGGYIILGTSNFGSQDTILLIKTDKNGEVN